MRSPLWHATGSAASTDSATSADDGTAVTLVIVLAVWLIYLTVGLVRAAVRMLSGVRLLATVVLLVGVPLTAIVVASVRLLV